MGAATFRNDDRLKDMVREAQAGKPKGAYDTRIEGTTVATLWFVKDQGVYLMAGTQKGGKPETVIYARGYDPEKDDFDDWWDKARRNYGGDDFAETVELSAELVADVLNDKVTKLKVTVTELNWKVEWFRAVEVA